MWVFLSTSRNAESMAGLVQEVRRSVSGLEILAAPLASSEVPSEGNRVKISSSWTECANGTCPSARKMWKWMPSLANFRNHRLDRMTKFRRRWQATSAATSTTSASPTEQKT